MTGEETAQWLEWRRGGFGGSDIGAARTGRYGGAYKVVADKLGIRVDADQIDPELAERGHRWERAIADGVHAHTGLYVAGEQAQMEHRTQPRWRCTADGLLLPIPQGSIDDVVGGLEVKTRGAHAPWPWDYWATQSQWSCLVTGLPRWLLAIATIDSEWDPTTGALTPEMVASTHYRWVYADPMLQEELIELADWLLGLVDRGELPEPTDAGALPYVKAANAEAGQPCPDCNATGKHQGEGRRKWCARCDGSGVANIDDPPDVDDLANLLARYTQLQDAAKAAEDERATAEAQIRQRMGEATEAHTSDGAWRIRVGLPVRKFTNQSEIDFIELHGPEHPELLRTTLDRAAAKEAMPEEYDALRFATADRRLTIKHTED